MKRRRKKSGLAGSQSAHGERQQVHLQRAHRHEGQAFTALKKRGDCAEAFDHIRYAQEAIGAYQAEKDWSGKASPREGEIKNQVKAVREEFEARCLIGHTR